MKFVAVLLALASSASGDFVECPYTGIFTDDPPFDRFPLPNCQDLVNPVYEMYTRTSRLTPQALDRFTVPSIFLPSQRTLFVVHGWGSDGTSSWLHGVKNAFLDREDGNVVIVDWGSNEGAGSIRYPLSASTTRTIGADLGDAMLNLVTNGGGDVSRMWCAGHSLGSHVCGYMGKRANDAMYRVTGVDPAGPLFANNTDPNNDLLGLRAGDAGFVDTINTDGLYGSSPVSLGQQNFFVNGGGEQPGCIGNSCDHGRAADLFLASIENPTDCFVADQRCGQGDYIESQCNNCVVNCPIMGYSATQGETGAFNVPTSGLGDYCP